MYIHLMKHWSEEFDKFKQVQSEVDLARKSISCDADRGDNDLSCDFGISLEDL